jgi:hypothetical protein
MTFLLLGEYSFAANGSCAMASRAPLLIKNWDRILIRWLLVDSSGFRWLGYLLVRLAGGFWSPLVMFGCLTVGTLRPVQISEIVEPNHPLDAG